jgi:hypothetical protein
MFVQETDQTQHKHVFVTPQASYGNLPQFFFVLSVEKFYTWQERHRYSTGSCRGIIAERNANQVMTFPEFSEGCVADKIETK